MRRAAVTLAAAAFAVSLANASRVVGVPPPWTAGLLLAAVLLGAEWSRRRDEGRGLFDAPAHVPLFLVCLTAYLATMRWHGGDDIPNSLIPFGVLRDATLSLEPFRAKFETERLSDFVVQGTTPLLSIFSPVPALVALPLYVLPAAAGGPPNDFGLHNLSKLAGSLITALSVVAVYAACRRRAPERASVLGALWYGLGTWSWSVSSQALHSHGPAQLGAALGLLGLFGERPRDAALAGFGFALALASREDSVFFLGAAGLALLANRPRHAGAFLLGGLGPGLVSAAYWLHYTGALKPPYLGTQGTMFGGFRPDALAGLLVSPTRGLLFYCPAALFGLYGLARGSDRRWAWPMLAASAALLAFLCFRTTWTAGQTFGPRYFAMAAALWAVAGAESGAATGPLFAAAFAASVLVHGLGAFLPYPGSFMTQGAESELWRWDLHPLVHSFSAAGALGGLPAAARAVLAAAVLAAGAALARWAHAFSRDPN